MTSLGRQFCDDVEGSFRMDFRRPLALTHRAQGFARGPSIQIVYGRWRSLNAEPGSWVGSRKGLSDRTLMSETQHNVACSWNHPHTLRIVEVAPVSELNPRLSLH